MINRELRIIVTTGGTGGHIFPALAVAEALQHRLSDAELLFVGGLYGQEAKLSQKAGIAFQGLPVRGFIGRGFRAVGAGWSMLKGIAEAHSIIREFRPSAVIGFGGYACFATVFAARLNGIPTLIHEQNAIPGAANKLLGKMVDRICLSLPDSGHIFDCKKCILTGNPIRRDIADLEKTPQKKPHLLIMGGSQGAVAINSLTIELLSALRDAGISIQHQTGEKDLARVREAYRSHGYTQEETEDMVRPFINNMVKAYAQADLVICRAGATSLAELAATGTPSILIPFPYAAHDHQTQNALSMQNVGGAVMIAEKDIPETDVKSLVLRLLRDDQKRKEMGQAATRLSNPDAAIKVANEVIGIANRKHK